MFFLFIVTSQKYLPNLAFGVEMNERNGPYENLNVISYMAILESLGFKV